MLRKKLTFILITFLIIGCQNGNENLPAVIPYATATVALPTSTHTAQPAIFIASPTSTLSVAATLIPTSTAIPTSIVYKRGLDIPIGDYYKFVIHKTKSGERLETYAEKYNTTVEAILAINYKLTNPTWSSILFVIPVGFSNVEDLPIFVVYEVKPDDRGISTEGLANLLRVNPVDLKYYNGMSAAGERPLVGDLILVPWSKPVQKIKWDEPDGTPEPEK